ncbi:MULTISPECIES: DUF4190 domain-containing protein [unclassified Motilimonas]|uniref:DUF4190 domain-containing protein n=1 Tax=Motilimonas TaxID=1914248 RepID=UPI001E43672A|nr:MULTISPECIES: DUF4190 domain-containing protein [unclassified Motilimonas]MCE0558233.1 DUF4190 domain-containing protein [Motilimonas sp. E26]MDO6526413.1 DUF4190 domain-containing protein [Motilimonas sp. 1_MG-2023]
MQGTVLDINEAAQTGLIKCDEGDRYEFSLAIWGGNIPPKTLDKVEFFVENGEVKHIAPLGQVQSSAPSQPNLAATMPNKPVETSPLAVVSLIFGILGIFIFGSLIAIICGHIARSNIRQSQGKLSGDGMALAGLITGYIGMVLFIGTLVMYAIIGAAEFGY